MTKFRNPDHLKVLQELNNLTANDYAVYFRTISRYQDIPERRVRQIVRLFVRKGWAEHVKGLFDEDGYLAGSGHRITSEGKKHLTCE